VPILTELTKALQLHCLSVSADVDNLPVVQSAKKLVVPWNTGCVVPVIQENYYGNTLNCENPKLCRWSQHNVKIYAGPQVRQESNKRPHLVTQKFWFEKSFIEYDSACTRVTTVVYNKIRDASRRLKPHCSRCSFQFQVTRMYCHFLT